MTEKKPKEENKTLFQQLRDIDVSPHVETKNKFKYLSWAWALDIMYQFDDTATFEFPEREVLSDGSVMIYCEVTIKGVTKRGFLPVMDFKNNAIKNPDARKVSDAMMRCLVKTIGLHGLGLSLYAGEDLPEENKEGNAPSPKKEERQRQMTGQEFLALQKEIKVCQNEQELESVKEKARQLWPLMLPPQREQITKDLSQKDYELDDIPQDFGRGQSGETSNE